MSFNPVSKGGLTPRPTHFTSFSRRLFLANQLTGAKIDVPNQSD